MYSPHVVTLTIVNNAGLTQGYNSAVLNGVFLDLNKRSNINRSGLTDADSATLFIPFSVSCTKTYVPPKEYLSKTDKSAYWTIFDNGEHDGAECYFVKGEAQPMSYPNAVKTYDYVYRVSSVDLRDFGSESMRHWMVGGR